MRAGQHRHPREAVVEHLDHGLSNRTHGLFHFVGDAVEIGVKPGCVRADREAVVPSAAGPISSPAIAMIEAAEAAIRFKLCRPL